MSQVENYTLPTSDPLNWAEFEPALNAILGAIKSANRGSTAPSNPVEGMTWWDTGTAGQETLKRYVSAVGWVALVRVDTASGAVTFPSATEFLRRDGSNAMTGPLKTDEIDEATADTGVDVDGARIKDGLVYPMDQGYPLALELIADSGAISSAATVEFTEAAAFDGTFRLLMLEMTGLVPSNDGVILQAQVRVGGSWGSSYRHFREQGYSNTGSAAGFGGEADAVLAIASFQGNSTGEGFSGVLEVADPTLSIRKPITWRGGGLNSAGNHQFVAGSGSYNADTALDGIRIQYGAGSVASGRIRLLGIRA